MAGGLPSRAEEVETSSHYFRVRSTGGPLTRSRNAAGCRAARDTDDDASVCSVWEGTDQTRVRLLSCPVTCRTSEPAVITPLPQKPHPQTSQATPGLRPSTSEASGVCRWTDPVSNVVPRPSAPGRGPKDLRFSQAWLSAHAVPGQALSAVMSGVGRRRPSSRDVRRAPPLPRDRLPNSRRVWLR